MVGVWRFDHFFILWKKGYKIRELDARGNFIPEPGNSDIDSTITYKCDEIDYFIDTKESYLNDLAQIEYQNMNLQTIESAA